MPERGILLGHGRATAQNCSATCGPLPQVEHDTANNKKSVPHNDKVSTRITLLLILPSCKCQHTGQSRRRCHGSGLRDRATESKACRPSVTTNGATDKENFVDAEKYTNIHSKDGSDIAAIFFEVLDK